MAKYIRFEKGPIPIDGRVAYKIVNKRAGNMLGVLLWYPTWRQYIFRSDENSVWSADCLADVQAFMATLAKPPAPEVERDPGCD